MQTKIQKWGNSQGLRFPKHILQEAHINIGDELNIIVNDGKIIIEPLNIVKRKYDIKELVSQMPPIIRQVKWIGENQLEKKLLKN